MVERVAILGIGVIGGSLALAWRERLPELRITGYDSPEILEQAKIRGLIDRTSSSVADAVHDADVVILAVPLDAMEASMESISSHLKHDSFVTDVASVKQPIIEAATRLLPDTIRFIGGHPMTGSERSGLDGADAFLFENAIYILCTDGIEDSEAYTPMIELIEGTGARVLLMDSKQHDRIVACVSHLPQLVATTLVNVVAERNHTDPITLQLAAAGFRDMTRIASSSFDMWSAVLESNCSDVDLALTSMIDALTFIRAQLREGGDIQKLRPIFEKASAMREKIPLDFKGFLRPLSDVFVYAVDQPGVLAHITGTLFRQGISIKDIELLKIREGTGGAFKISLENDQMADAAVIALKSHGCRAHRLR